MPACANESLAKLWPGSPGSPGSPAGSPPSGSSPCSPASRSPPSTSPPPRLRRSLSSSTALAYPREQASPPPLQQHHHHHHHHHHHEEVPGGLLALLIGWYPAFLLRFARNLLAALVYLSWSQLLLAGPTLWLSAWLWLFWKAVQLPLALAKGVLQRLYTPAAERARRKRTVLISGGSSVQALHLARNFHSAGTRVVVCEVEGLFGLARFSTAVHRFYTVPPPSADSPYAYVRALCDIAVREEAEYYLPVCSSTPAYYDALAKPDLELLGCSVFCPGLEQTTSLDDTLEVLRRCRARGLATPVFYPVHSREDVLRLYEAGVLRQSRFFLQLAGLDGCRERVKLALPTSRHEFRALAPAVQPALAEHRPWVVVQDVVGEHYLTCTTVKSGQVVANVTCRLEQGLVPVESDEVTRWLEAFFARMPVTGHFRFRLVRPASASAPASAPGRTPSGSLLPLGCRVGVSLPYLCHTSVHPRIVIKPCRHFSRQASGPLVSGSGRYWMHEAVLDTLKRPSVEAVSKLIGTVLDKREALFVFWDPLPYCAYYHLQLPARHLLGFLQGRGTTCQRTATTPVAVQ
ncbi:Protein piccolo [Frankliniella fusca]|uniref:Protein piccolo n=1 Tax=Frankliniella fusca TaxID=407009 RepID=A0AAE1LCW5_9NEOP|nr:Protein piccolo [Frankliniella fusca]